MMTYLVGYLFFGALILTTISVVRRMDNSQDAKELRNIRRLINRPPASWQGKLLELIIAPVIAATLAVLFWPVVVIWVVKDRLSSRAYENRIISEPEAFKVKKENLIEMISIEDIESYEMIVDPLNAVPNVPFGHLNPAWQQFKQKLQSEDEIWLFSAQWTSEWGSIDHRTGYVIIQEDKPVDYFTVSIKYVD